MPNLRSSYVSGDVGLASLEGIDGQVSKEFIHNVTNIIFLASWMVGEHRNLSTAFSGGDNCGYCLYIGPMLKSSGALLQAYKERYRQPAVNLALLKILSKLLESGKWMICTLEYLEQFYSSAGVTCKVSNKPKLAKSALTPGFPKVLELL